MVAEKLNIPRDWSWNAEVAEKFGRHVREQLPWYALATGIVAHIARAYLPVEGLVVDVGASDGNIGRALSSLLAARRAVLVPIDSSPEMIRVYTGPGSPVLVDAVDFDFAARAPDLIVCFLSLMFVPLPAREALLDRLKRSLRPGGAVVVFDKMIPGDGYIGTVSYRLTLAAKLDGGACPADVIAKELSISGVQRPLSVNELADFVEIFRFGDFAGWIWEA